MPPGPDEAKDSRGPDIGLESVEREREELGHELGENAPAQRLERSRPRRAHGLDGTGVDGLDRFRVELGQHRRGVRDHGQHTGERPEADGGHEEEGVDESVHPSEEH